MWIWAAGSRIKARTCCRWLTADEHRTLILPEAADCADNAGIVACSCRSSVEWGNHFLSVRHHGLQARTYTQEEGRGPAEEAGLPAPPPSYPSYPNSSHFSVSDYPAGDRGQKTPLITHFHINPQQTWHGAVSAEFTRLRTKTSRVYLCPVCWTEDTAARWTSPFLWISKVSWKTPLTHNLPSTTSLS